MSQDKEVLAVARKELKEMTSRKLKRMLKKLCSRLEQSNLKHQITCNSELSIWWETEKNESSR